LDLVSSAAASQSTDPEGPPKLDVSRTQVGTLESTLRELVAQYRGLATLERLTAKDASPSAGQRPLVERLHQFAGAQTDLHNLVPYPPQMLPVPVKPLFFDVAWNYIDYPRLGGAEKSEAMETEKKEGRRGWFGFGR
jgi:signal recognition particle subunit SRP68